MVQLCECIKKHWMCEYTKTTLNSSTVWYVNYAPNKTAKNKNIVQCNRSQIISISISFKKIKSPQQPHSSHFSEAFPKLTFGIFFQKFSLYTKGVIFTVLQLAFCTWQSLHSYASISVRKKKSKTKHLRSSIIVFRGMCI